MNTCLTVTGTGVPASGASATKDKRARERYPLPAMTDPRRFARATFVLIFAAFVVYLIGNADVPLWDRDEPRYAQCSRQMYETGDWVLPRYLDDIRLAKPPLIYWLQGGSMAMLGRVDEFAARFPSAVAMALTLLLVAISVRRALSVEHAFWSVLVLGASAMTVISAKACLTDSVLLLFITIAQLCLYRIWIGRGTWPVVVTLGLAIGLTLMTKGPVGLGIHAMTFVGYGFLTWTLKFRKTSAVVGDGVEQRESSEVPIDERAKPQAETPPAKGSALSKLLKTLAVPVIAIGVCLPWVVLVEQRWAELPADVRAEAAAKGSERKRAANPTAQSSTGENGYIWTVLEKEVFDRSKNAQEGHSGPPGYYLAAIWGIFLPWSLLLPATLVIAWKRRHLAHVRFALGAVLGPWLMFEIIQTKLPHYMLPCFVPLAILTADAIIQCLRHGVAALSDNGFRRGVIAWGIVMFLLGLVPWLAATWFTPQPWGVLAGLSILVAVYVAFVVRAFLKGETQRGLVTMGLGALLLFGALFRIYLPACDYLRLAPKTAAVLREQGATGKGAVLMLDYKEPSLAFYQGGSIREHSATIITPKLLEITKPVQWYVVTRDMWNASAPKNPGEPDARDMLEIISTAKGLDVADGMRNVEVMVVKRK